VNGGFFRDDYIVRIHRRQEDGKSPASTGVVENTQSGKMAKFADSSGLLKILRRKFPLKNGKFRG
jgi:hypothetical protein